MKSRNDLLKWSVIHKICAIIQIKMKEIAHENTHKENF